MPTSTARKLLYFDPTYAVPTEIASTDTATLAKIALTGIGGVGIDAGSQLISNLADPVSPQDAVTKRYVDALEQGLSVLPSVLVMSTTNIASLSGLQTIDGVTLVDGNRVLLTGQTDQTKNGIWIAHSGAWTRPTTSNDMLTGSGAAGKFCFVESGATYAKEGWVCNSLPGSDVVDTSPLTYTQFTGLGDVTVAAGLLKSGADNNAISINLAPSSGLTFTSNALDHLLAGTGSLQKSASGLAVKLNGTTLTSTTNGLAVQGLPSLFQVAGNPVDANVTAANLNVLVDGNGSLADSLHSHKSVLGAQTVTFTATTGVALNAGDPVGWSSTASTLYKCDAAALGTAQCIGIATASAAANSQVAVLKQGISPAVLSGGSAGLPVYLAIGGGLTTSLATNISSSVVRIGYCVTSSVIDVGVQYIGQRAAA